MATHDIGDSVRLWVVFRDEAGDQAAPTTVTLIVRPPDGVDETVTNEAADSGDVTIAAAATGETLADETGVYKATVEIDQSGPWFYEWAGTGALTETVTGSFSARIRRVADPA